MEKAEITMDQKGIVDYICADGNGLLTVPKDARGFTADALLLLDEVKEIVVEEGNPRYRAEGCCLINAETETVIYAGENAVVPDGVKVVGACAFHWDDDRTSMDLDPLRLPDGLKEIRYRAFAVSSERKIHIIVPASVERVGLMAFMMHGAGVSEVTFLGDPTPEIGVFGTKAELFGIEHFMLRRGVIDGDGASEEQAEEATQVLRQVPECICTKPESILVHAPADSEMAGYCKHYGIPFESLKEGEV